MTDFKTGSVKANEINFHYLEMGQGPLVPCMHGFPDNAYSFRHLLPALAQAGFRAVAPFMRGYAPTEAPKDDQYDAVLLCKPTFPIWLNIPLSKSSAYFKPLSICETLAVGMAIITP